MLRIDHIKVPGLEPMSFSVQAGECIALMGPSGSGKTLLLRAIADLDSAPGHIFLEGAERGEMSGPAWRCAVRYVAAEPGWWAETVGEHFPDVRAGHDAHERLLRLLDSLGLAPEILESTVARASTGERQRLALARSLAGEPKVLLLDEPTASLDPTSAALVEEAVRYQLLRSRAVLVVTHDVAQAQRLARKLIRLEGGAGHFYEFSTQAGAAGVLKGTSA
jgi:ABC-type iron transport system FetAB ATPase subunit